MVGGRRLGFGDGGKPLSPRALANERAEVGVGMVFQHFNLFSHLTARENIAGPLRWVHGWSHTDADRRAFELLDRVGLRPRADALPRHLSGGQQQRVAIARALAPNPSVLLLDEPTSALDPELVNEVLEVIRRLAIEDGLTMIISTHQLRFAEEVADRVVLLSDGAIVEQGPARDVLTNPQTTIARRFLSATRGARRDTLGEQTRKHNHTEAALTLFGLCAEVLRRIRLERPEERKHPAETRPAEHGIEERDDHQIVALAPVRDQRGQKIECNRRHEDDDLEDGVSRHVDPPERKGAACGQ